MDLVIIKEKLTRLFRNAKTQLTKTERKYLKGATMALQAEVSYRQGVLAGIKTAADVIEGRMSDS